MQRISLIPACTAFLPCLITVFILDQRVFSLCCYNIAILLSYFILLFFYFIWQPLIRKTRTYTVLTVCINSVHVESLRRGPAVQQRGARAEPRLRAVSRAPRDSVRAPGTPGRGAGGRGARGGADGGCARRAPLGGTATRGGAQGARRRAQRAPEGRDGR